MVLSSIALFVLQVFNGKFPIARTVLYLVYTFFSILQSYHHCINGRFGWKLHLGPFAYICIATLRLLGVHVSSHII